MSGTHATPKERLLRHVESSPSGCLVWTGAKNSQGYGSMSFGRGTILAHRLSCIVHFGEIPHGLCVLHRCDNPSCIRPEHLFAGTKLDNAIDMIQKGRKVILRGASHPRSKMTVENVNVIRTSNLSASLLASMYGVSRKQIHRIRTGVLWRNS